MRDFSFFQIVPSWKSKRGSMGLQLGGNLCPNSVQPSLRRCCSQQGAQTDSWEICTDVQLDHDECKDVNLFVIYDASHTHT